MYERTYVALQYQIMDHIDDLGHGDFLSALTPRWMRELDWLAIAQKSARKQQIVDICRRGLEVIRLHFHCPESARRRCARAMMAMSFNVAVVQCLFTKIPRVHPEGAATERANPHLRREGPTPLACSLPDHASS